MASGHEAPFHPASYLFFGGGTMTVHSNKVNKILFREHDRSNWNHGEWDNEPDRVDFIESGFSCFILRNQFGNWCGYVGLPKEHKYYEKGYNDIPVNVHGGITYARKCYPPICHNPEPGMPDDVYWVGFDTSHYDDLSPSKHITLGTYKNMYYAIDETRNLAKQLSEIGG